MRIARGWTQARLGEEVNLSGSRIAQFERAEDVPPRDITELLDKALGAGGLLVEMHPFLKRPWHQKWPEDLADIESRAKKIQTYTFVIPGFLQTREYAAGILSSGTPFFSGDLNEKIEARMTIQDVLEGPNHPWLRCIVDESALYRAVCPPDAMRDQLLHLLKACERPRITFQVLPFKENRLFVLDTSMVILWTLTDGSILAHEQDTDNGHFITDPKKVELLVSLYDQLHVDALSADASLSFVQRVLEDRYS
ncbi:helix-turn-helix domain-containing protein [Streptomyces sp. AV19]|nr:helix-turn-helix domain-containing protein [Streptomyces sp. AV19]